MCLWYSTWSWCKQGRLSKYSYSRRSSFSRRSEGLPSGIIWFIINFLHIVSTQFPRGFLHCFVRFYQTVTDMNHHANDSIKYFIYCNLLKSTIRLKLRLFFNKEMHFFIFTFLIYLFLLSLIFKFHLCDIFVYCFLIIWKIYI